MYIKITKISKEKVLVICPIQKWKFYGEKLNMTEHYLRQINRFAFLSIGCPGGFFRVNGSDNCFKFFHGEKTSWDETQRKCKKENLETIHPTSKVAVTLRKYLIDNYGIFYSVLMISLNYWLMRKYIWCIKKLIIYQKSFN